ncbi:universal stress protein [Paenibacillus filicis]|uniref:Universal stress protein n=1 Tax=Paenibacillus gyeongsangnamensis TaxID=3388067 RepID=A0ABT4QFC2_9BACL|nr:universal stress protein [Paenibacillus filicis]MCZ8515577.1 universal stress protein [Paenibacillus filicis]
MPYTNVLVAYDGSKASEKALDSAVQLARLNPDTKLEVLHVFQLPTIVVGEAFVTAPPEVSEEEYERSNALVEKAKLKTAGLPGAKVTTLQGPAAKLILEHAEETGSDLIVIGSRGLSGWGELMLGSVSHNVVQHAKIPVLVIK